MDAEILASAINGGMSSQTSQFDEGNSWAMTLVGKLRATGWKTAKSYDYCSKASYEAYLEKGGAKVRVITTCFLGVFTQVEIRGNGSNKHNSIRFME